MEDQALYMEQLNWHLYREQKDNWDNTAAKDRKGPPPKEPDPIFSDGVPKEQKNFDRIAPDIGDTVPVEEN